jgi:hypothetical protein
MKQFCFGYATPLSAHITNKNFYDSSCAWCVVDLSHQVIIGHAVGFVRVQVGLS